MQCSSEPSFELHEQVYFICKVITLEVTNYETTFSNLELKIQKQFEKQPETESNSHGSERQELALEFSQFSRPQLSKFELYGRGLVK